MLTEDMQKRYTQLLSMATGHELILQTILENLHNSDACKEQIHSRLKQLAFMQDQNAPQGSNEYAMMLRRFGGSYP